MIRLTERFKGVVLCSIDCPEECMDGNRTACSDCDHFLAMIKRLAAYEDTGLTPKQLQQKLKTWQEG